MGYTVTKREHPKGLVLTSTVSVTINKEQVEVIEKFKVILDAYTGVILEILTEDEKRVFKTLCDCGLFCESEHGFFFTKLGFPFAWAIMGTNAVNEAGIDHANQKIAEIKSKIAEQKQEELQFRYPERNDESFL